MAKGDVKADLQNVTNNNPLIIKPTGTDEYVVHNIYYSGAVEFYKVSSVGSLKFDNDATLGGRLGAVFHVTATQWIEIKNISGASILIGYDGIQTK